MAKLEARDIITRLKNIPQIFQQAQELRGVMRRNSRIMPTEVVATEKVKPRRQLPRWVVAMRVAAEEKNPPAVVVSEANQTDEVPAAVRGIVTRRENSRKATEGMVRYAQRGVQRRTEDALMSHQIEQMFKHGVITEEDEVFK